MVGSPTNRFWTGRKGLLFFNNYFYGTFFLLTQSFILGTNQIDRQFDRQTDRQIDISRQMSIDA